MFRGYTYGDFAPYLILVVGLTLIATAFWFAPYSKGYQAANDAASADHAAYQAQQDRYEECLQLPSLGEARTCALKSRPVTREHHRAEYDLNAHREMAQWAEAMFWVTFVGVVMGAIGAVLILGTLFATREMNEIVRLEQRPWLRIDVNRVEELTVHGDGNITGTIDIVCRNLGKTAAENVQISAIPLSSRNMSYPNFADYVAFELERDHLRTPKNVCLPDDEITLLVPFEITHDPAQGIHLISGERMNPNFVFAVTYTQSNNNKSNVFFSGQLVGMADAWTPAPGWFVATLPSTYHRAEIRFNQSKHFRCAR